MESAPKRFLLETEGEPNGEKQEIDENADTAIPHIAAPSGVRGGMDRIKKQRMKQRNNKGISCGGSCMLPFMRKIRSVKERHLKIVNDNNF